MIDNVDIKNIYNIYKGLFIDDFIPFEEFKKNLSDQLYFIDFINTLDIEINNRLYWYNNYLTLFNKLKYKYKKD